MAQGRDSFDQVVVASVQQSDTIYAIVMAANTAQYITPPAGANFVLFAASGGNDFYMLLNVTSGLSVPAANNTAGTSPELNPLIRELKGATSIGLVTTAACNITMAFYS
jgi:hypothetical protein